ncbi:MAG: large subunit ribosomal protein [Thermoplasmata archaeon]|jgi:large subunit ribosomal protein L10|nr:large subunit ribosomal protein [Thermoplasmata archaeon]MEA3165963.1 large subunit ribosomal protein [Thermoplasmata archaeon]
MTKGSTRGHAHVAPWKKDEVDRLAKILTDNPVVAIAEVSGIPAPQMQQMRASLRGQVAVVGSKNRLLAIAIEQAAKSRPGLEALAGKLHGQSVILATKNNPFKLFKSLKAGASMAPLKGGQVAPHDIVIPKGGTPFGPGPIVGELQKVGISAKIEGGKVVIAKESTPVKAGAIVSPELATMLAKLEIRPVELKIDLKAAFEHDTMFLPDALGIDEDFIMGQLGIAVRTANEVSLQTGWITPQTADALLGRAYKQAIALVLEQGLDVDAAVKQTVTEDYAKVLASIGKKESDLSDELKARLGDAVKILSQVAVAAPSSAGGSKAPEAEEKPEEKGVSEEEAAAGLGALFG